MKRIARLLGGFCLACGACACTATFNQQPGGGFTPPTVVMDTPGGNYPIYTPNTATGPSAEPSLAVPPGMGLGGGGGPVPPPPGSNDGTYDGVASMSEEGGVMCPMQMRMTNMHVRNGHVRFASYRGTIDENGNVQMADGSANWITGHFADGQFNGTYVNRYCGFTVTLYRVGP